MRSSPCPRAPHSSGGEVRKTQACVLAGGGNESPGPARAFLGGAPRSVGAFGSPGVPLPCPTPGGWAAAGQAQGEPACFPSSIHTLQRANLGDALSWPPAHRGRKPWRVRASWCPPPPTPLFVEGETEARGGKGAGQSSRCDSGAEWGTKGSSGCGRRPPVPPPRPGNGMWARPQGPSDCRLFTVPGHPSPGLWNSGPVLRAGGPCCPLGVCPACPPAPSTSRCVCWALVGFGDIGRVGLLAFANAAFQGEDPGQRGKAPPWWGPARFPDGLSTPSGCHLISLRVVLSLGLQAPPPCLPASVPSTFHVPQELPGLGDGWPAGAGQPWAWVWRCVQRLMALPWTRAQREPGNHSPAPSPRVLPVPTNTSRVGWGCLRWAKEGTE